MISPIMLRILTVIIYSPSPTHYLQYNFKEYFRPVSHVESTAKISLLALKNGQKVLLFSAKYEFGYVLKC